MSKQKRQEEEIAYSDDQDEDQKSSANEDSKKGDRKFDCKCGKFYPLQSSLFNHIRIKHDDKKEEWAIPRNVKPGRPKNVEGGKVVGQKKKKGEKKPDGVDEKTWVMLKLYQNPLFQNLIIKFKDCMKNQLVTSNNEQQDDSWKEYVAHRDKILPKVLPKMDIQRIINDTDFLLQRWGILLDKEHKFNLYTSYLIAFVIKFYKISPEKQDILKKGWSHLNTVEELFQILTLDYPENFNEEQEQQQEKQELPKEDDGEVDYQNPQDIDQVQNEHAQNNEQYQDHQNQQFNHQNQYPLDDNNLFDQQGFNGDRNNNNNNNNNNNAINDDEDEDFNPNIVQQTNFANYNNQEQFYQFQNQSQFNQASLKISSYRNMMHINKQQSIYGLNDVNVNFLSFNNITNYFQKTNEEEEDYNQDEGYYNEKDDEQEQNQECYNNNDGQQFN